MANRRTLMHGIDHGYDDAHPSTPEMALMKCGRCGHDAGWMRFKTPTEVKRGVPCPVCSPDTTSEQHSAPAANWLLRISEHPFFICTIQWCVTEGGRELFGGANSGSIGEAQAVALKELRKRGLLEADEDIPSDRLSVEVNRQDDCAEVELEVR